jgi:Starch-binding associating with outer membrane
MKRYILQITTIISLGVLLLTNGGCAKISDFGDTNLDPNGVPQPILSALLTNASIAVGGQTITQPPALFAQYVAEATYPGTSLYAGLEFESSGNYSGVLQDLQVILNRCQDPAFASAYGDVGTQIGVATLLKTYVMWTLTDRWGDLPYTEALSGGTNPLPKYDEQKDIYEKMLSEITFALTQLNPSGVAIKGDVFYGGDVAKWRKFGNSLRMLIALRMSKRYPAPGGLAATEFQKSLANGFGYISTNADNFALKYPGGAFLNPIYGQNISQDNSLALTFTDALNGMGDTRRLSMASLPNGAPYGLAGAAPIGTPYARMGNGTFAAADGRMVIMNAASLLLAHAEATERGWVTGGASAQSLYEAGVTASFAQWAQTMPASYLAGGVADYNVGTGVGSIGGTSVPGTNGITGDKFKRIALQQWIAFYPDGVQGWSNWRRTGFPDLKPTVNAQPVGTQIPRRYKYGLTDFASNKAAVEAAIAKIPGGNSQDAKMWWDQ